MLLPNAEGVSQKGAGKEIMRIRKYGPQDCEALFRLYHDTVHSVNARDYSQRQLDAWSDGTWDPESWNRSFLEHNTVVAVEDGGITGFGDMDPAGYLDRLYVHKDHQGKGIASAICEELERSVCADRITVHASITAKPFFENRGYVTLREQQVERKGVRLTNYVMEKRMQR